MECPGCGHLWESEIQVRQDDLIEVLSQHQQDLPMIEFFRSQRQNTFREGSAPAWAKRLVYEKFDRMPEAHWSRGAIFGDEPTLQDKYTYRDYLAAIAQRQGKDISWIIEEFQQEFGKANWQEVFYSR
jgi:DNA repair protein RadD